MPKGPRDLKWVKAPHPVKCEAGGKHNPRTLERIVRGDHLKVSVCRGCNKIV